MTTISDLVTSGRITFGAASKPEWNTDSLVDGGWINVDVPVYLDREALGTAHIGAWVVASTGGNIDAETHDEVTRRGYAIKPYTGASDHERRWIYANELVADLDDLADEEDDAVAAIMDAAEESHAVDYDEVFAEALRDRLDEPLSTLDLLRAIQAIAA